jgi:hypothetical protein
MKAGRQSESPSTDLISRGKEELVFLKEARGNCARIQSWKRVNALVRRSGSPREKDEPAVRRAPPESGSFVLVSLRRRKRRGNSEISSQETRLRTALAKGMALARPG